MNKKLYILPILLTFWLLILIPIHTKALNDVTIDGNEVKISAKKPDGSTINNVDDAFTLIMDKYKGIITFVSGLASVTLVGIFIYNFTKLGLSSTQSNPMERQKTITGLIISGIAAALLGSVTLFTGIFYGAFK